MYNPNPIKERHMRWIRGDKGERKGRLEELRDRNHFSTTNILGMKGMDGRGVGLGYGEGRYF